jgi:hypothetical protein
MTFFLREKGLIDGPLFFTNAPAVPLDSANCRVGCVKKQLRIFISNSFPSTQRSDGLLALPFVLTITLPWILNFEKTKQKLDLSSFLCSSSKLENVYVISLLRRRYVGQHKHY